MMRGLILPILMALVTPAFGAAMTNCHLNDDFEGAVDQDGARAAVRRGDAAPFEKILKTVRPQIQGEIVGQILEQHQGVWLYEFRVVAPDGHMHYMHFGARSGRYVELKTAQCSS
ncbi:MAG TPA: hypothetical protein VN175_05285 [Rhizomicrobium sp.]|nr:hypothetical protein [Rhizomicrobium sp.]